MIEQDATHAKKPKLSPSLGCIENNKMGRENQQACLYTAFKRKKLFTLWSFGVPIKTAGNTGVSLQGMAKYCLNMFVAYNLK